MTLIVCEIAEAVEADRKDSHANLAEYEEMPNDISFIINMKDTVEDELADVCIRTLDFIGLKGYEIPNDIDAHIRHSTLIKEYYLSEGFSSAVCQLAKCALLGVITQLLADIFSLCEVMHIDILRHIQLKMEYNRTRPRLHGKKY